MWFFDEKIRDGTLSFTQCLMNRPEKKNDVQIELPRKNPKFRKSGLMFGVNTVGSLTQHHSLGISVLSSFTVQGGKVKWECSQAPSQLEEHSALAKEI